MEKQGIGINNVFAYCEQAGLAEPRFMELEQYVKIVLYKYEITKPNEQRSMAPNITMSGVTLKNAEYISILSTMQHATSQEFAQRIGKSQAMAKKILNALVRNGEVKMVGKARATWYALG